MKKLTAYARFLTCDIFKLFRKYNRVLELKGDNLHETINAAML